MEALSAGLAQDIAIRGVPCLFHCGLLLELFSLVELARSEFSFSLMPQHVSKMLFIRKNIIATSSSFAILDKYCDIKLRLEMREGSTMITSREVGLY